MGLGLSLCKSVFMTSLMTSPGHKVGEISIAPPMIQLERRSKAQNVGNAPGRLSYCYIQLPALFPVKNIIVTSKSRAFWKFWNIEHSVNLTSDMKKSSSIMENKYFSLWWRHRWRHRVTRKLPSIFISLGEFGPRSPLQGQVLVKKCKYRNRRSRFYMSEEGFNK